MFIILSIWIILLLLVISLGSVSYAIFIKLLGCEYKSNPNLFQLSWLGYASLIGYLQIVSILFAVNTQAAIFVLLLALICSFSSYKYVLQCFSDHRNTSFRLKAILTMGFAILASYISFQSSFPPAFDDTGLYHFNAVKWASSYPAIPGIVNLHGRLAFNSSFHLFAALTNSGPFEDRAVHLANGFLVLLICFQWFTSIVSIPREGARLHHAFACITAPYLLKLSSEGVFPSLATDRPFHILCLVAIYELLSVKNMSECNLVHWHESMNTKNMFSWVLVLTLVVVAFTTKLSGAPILLTFLPVSLALLALFCKKNGLGYISVRHLAAMYGLPIILITGLVVRFIILSGWLVYPIPIGNLHLDWSASPEEVIDELNWIKSWARAPGELPDVVLSKGISYWFPAWFAKIRQSYVLPLLCVGIVGMIYVCIEQLRKWRKVAEVLPLYLSMSLGLFGLIFWFLSAPEVRFGLGYLWIFSAASIAPLFLRYFKYHVQGFAIIILAAAITAAGIKGHVFKGSTTFYTKLPPFLSISPVERKSIGYLVPVLIHNEQTPPLIIYKPADDDRCENSLLPCSPYVEEDSSIALRVPGDLRSGFKTTGARWVGSNK